MFMCEYIVKVETLKILSRDCLELFLYDTIL